MRSCVWNSKVSAVFLDTLCTKMISLVNLSLCLATATPNGSKTTTAQWEERPTSHEKRAKDKTGCNWHNSVGDMSVKSWSIQTTYPFSETLWNGQLWIKRKACFSPGKKKYRRWSLPNTHMGGKFAKVSWKLDRHLADRRTEPVFFHSDGSKPSQKRLFRLVARAAFSTTPSSCHTSKFEY